MKRFAAAIVLLSVFTGAGAQMRPLPAETESGTIRHLQGMTVSINGKPMQLAPGATIRGQNNLIIVPTALPPDGAAAEYLVDGNGQITRVWLVTPEEAARERPPKP
jgi:hypothetical protein